MGERYKIGEIDNERYISIPVSMFTNEYYRDNLSLSSKFVYAFLRNRLTLSMQNGWIDDNGDVYMYYEQSELADTVGVGKRTIINSFKELVAVGLVDTVRQGLGKPNRIYVKKLGINNSCTSTVKKVHFREEKTALINSNDCVSDVQKLHSNYPNINYPDISNLNRENDVVVVNARDTTNVDDCQEENVKKCVAVYESNIRPIAGEIERDMVVELITDYGSEWFCAAVKEAVAHSARSVKYISGVLENWKMHGRGGSRRTATKPRSPNTSSIQETYEDAQRLLKEWGYGE